MLIVASWGVAPERSSGSGAHVAVVTSLKMHAAQPAETAAFRSASLAAVATFASNAVMSAAVHAPVCGAAGGAHGSDVAAIGVVSGHVMGPPLDELELLDDDVDPPLDEVDPPLDEVDPPLDDDVDEPPLDEVEDPPLEVELPPEDEDDELECLPLLPELVPGSVGAASARSEVTSTTFEVQPSETSRTDETAVAVSTKPTFFIRSSKKRKVTRVGKTPASDVPCCSAFTCVFQEND